MEKAPPPQGGWPSPSQGLRVDQYLSPFKWRGIKFHGKQPGDGWRSSNPGYPSPFVIPQWQISLSPRSLQRGFAIFWLKLSNILEASKDERFPPQEPGWLCESESLMRFLSQTWGCWNFIVTRVLPPASMMPAVWWPIPFRGYWVVCFCVCGVYVYSMCSVVCMCVMCVVYV